LKELDLAESFGLDRRIERHEGKRPLGLYRWHLECLVESLAMVLDGRYYGELPPNRRPTVQGLHDSDPVDLNLVEIGIPRGLRWS
jgi:hypothetical protein